MTPEQQAAFDEIKASVEEIKTTVSQSLNIQAYGGYHIFNLAIPLEKKLDKLEALLNQEAPVAP